MNWLWKVLIAALEDGRLIVAPTSTRTLRWLLRLSGCLVSGLTLAQRGSGVAGLHFLPVADHLLEPGFYIIKFRG